MLGRGVGLKTIPGFPDYSITMDGRVWSRKNSGRWLKRTLTFFGYRRVELCKSGRRFPRTVHRLMLETFIGPCPSGFDCRHLDGIRTHNNLSNLRWGTRSENVQDTYRHGRGTGGENHGQAKLKERQVRQLIYVYQTGLFSYREVANQIKISSTTAWQFVNKKRWKHIWQV